MYSEKDSTDQLTPAELLMGRHIKADVPQLKKLLVPDWLYLEGFREIDSQNKRKQKKNYDRQHRAPSTYQHY